MPTRKQQAQIYRGCKALGCRVRWKTLSGCWEVQSATDATNFSHTRLDFLFQRIGSFWSTDSCPDSALCILPKVASITACVGNKYRKCPSGWIFTWKCEVSFSAHSFITVGSPCSGSSAYWPGRNEYEHHSWGWGICRPWTVGLATSRFLPLHDLSFLHEALEFLKSFATLHLCFSAL